MSVRDDLGEFLVQDIAANISTSTTIRTGWVYRGQRPRADLSPIDVRVAYRNRLDLERKTGKLMRYSWDAVITSSRSDASQEEQESGLVADIADEMVDRYNGPRGGLSIISVPNAALESSSARRKSPQVDERAGRRSTVVEIAIDVWEVES